MAVTQRHRGRAHSVPLVLVHVVRLDRARLARAVDALEAVRGRRRRRVLDDVLVVVVEGRGLRGRRREGWQEILDYSIEVTPFIHFFFNFAKCAEHFCS